MERYTHKNGKKMRYGYTTGSCAAAAAKAATTALFRGDQVGYMTIDTPKGWPVTVEITHVQKKNNSATCYVVKDAGDDPDVTHGIRVYATAMITVAKDIEIEGGIGIGRVTKKGLQIPVGDAAINPIPLQMIRKEVAGVLPENTGVRLLIFVPEGRAIAEKTFNPKLGIIGGISILGTTGIVEPMSEEAFSQSLKVELSVKAASGRKKMIYVFGNFGREYLGQELREDRYQKTSNFVRTMIREAVNLGIEEILYVGHAGKMVKIAAGMPNTHSNYGDNRMTTLANCGKAVGLTGEVQKELLMANTTEEAMDILDEWGVRNRVMKEVADKCKAQCEAMAEYRLNIECVIFTTKHGTLAKTEGAKSLMKEIME